MGEWVVRGSRLAHREEARSSSVSSRRFDGERGSAEPQPIDGSCGECGLLGASVLTRSKSPPPYPAQRNAKRTRPRARAVDSIGREEGKRMSMEWTRREATHGSLKLTSTPTSLINSSSNNNPNPLNPHTPQNAHRQDQQQTSRGSASSLLGPQFGAFLQQRR